MSQVTGERFATKLSIEPHRGFDLILAQRTIRSKNWLGPAEKNSGHLESPELDV